jgi:hypothetical protein
MNKLVAWQLHLSAETGNKKYKEFILKFSCFNEQANLVHLQEGDGPV